MSARETFADSLRRWNRDCTGWEPSMSLLQRGADDAADLIDELCEALQYVLRRHPYYTTQVDALNRAEDALAKARGGQ